MKTLKNGALMAIALISLLCLQGCTVDGGDVAEHDKNKIMECTDTRDGEKFSFNTNDVKNVRQGIGAPSAFDVTTTDGKEKTLSSDMETFLKCEKKT